MKRFWIFLAGLNGGIGFMALLLGAYDMLCINLIGIAGCVLAARGDPK